MLHAGAGSAVIPIQPGEPLAGYALRADGCTGSHDPLCARAVLLDDGSTRVVLVVLDLLYVPAALDDLVRTAAATAAQAPPAHILVSATHTHAGPAGLATNRAVQERIARAAGSAVTAARDTRSPAILAIADRRVRGISANRRTPAGAPDDEAQIIVARTADGQRTIATVMAFACHPTVLDHRATESSADFPGSFCRQLERQVGGTALYLQGAAGDVNPVRAEPTHGECERIGGVLAATAAEVVLQTAGAQQGLRTESPSLQAEFDAAQLAGARLLTDVALGSRWTDVAVAPGPPLPPPDEIAAERAALPGPPGAEDARRWIEQLRAEQPNLFGVFDDGPPTRIRLQHMVIGPDLALLGMPGEPFTATAQALRTAAAGALVVVGYAHQSIGYLPPATEWALGGYEVGCCFYTDAIEGELRAGALRLLAHGDRVAIRPASPRFGSAGSGPEVTNG